MGKLKTRDDLAGALNHLVYMCGESDYTAEEVAGDEMDAILAAFDALRAERDGEKARADKLFAVCGELLPIAKACHSTLGNVPVEPRLTSAVADSLEEAIALLVEAGAVAAGRPRCAVAELRAALEPAPLATSSREVCAALNAEMGSPDRGVD